MPASRREQQKVAERRARALQLRAAGASYQQIADTLGHKTASNAAQDVTRALRAAGEADLQLAGLHRALELERLDLAERAASQIRAAAQQGGDPDTALRAIDRMLRISDRRARLLGLAAAETAPPRDREGSVVDQLAARRAARRNRFSAQG